jgi:hypothetical protein
MAFAIRTRRQPAHVPHEDALALRTIVVRETYESAVIMADGYNNELLKSEAEMIEELEQAIGEPLPLRPASVASHVGEPPERPAASV